jgi:hypothetical protein
VATFARRRYVVSIVDCAFGIHRNVLSSHYQDDLYSVRLEFLSAAVRFAGVVDVAEDVAVSPCIEDMVLVVDEVIGDLVFFWAMFSEKVLSLVMHGVGHYVPGVLPNDCTFWDRRDRSESNAGIIWGLKSGYIAFRVNRRTCFFVLAERVYTVVSVTENSRGIVVA